MKKNGNPELLVIESCRQGPHVTIFQRSRARTYQYLSFVEVLSAILISEPKEIRISLSDDLLPLLSRLHYSKFSSRLRVFGRYVPGGMAHTWHRMQGGLRRLDQFDVPILETCTRLLSGRSSKDESLSAISKHPVWPYLTFPLGIDLSAVAAVMLAVVDPRAHFLPSHDAGGCEVGKLRRALGITRRRSNRTRTDAGIVAAAWGLAAAEHVTTSDPRAYFISLYHRLQVYGFDEEEAEFRVSSKYVAFLQRTWLESVRTSGSEKIFDAQKLFGDADTVQALQNHLDSVAGSKTNS